MYLIGMSRTPNANTTTGLFWFRHDLRTIDNSAFREMAGLVDRMLCVYVVDPDWFTPRHFQSMHMGQFRWKFICESLLELEEELKGKGQRLIVLYDNPLVTIPKLVNTYNVTHVAASAYCGVNEIQQWSQIKAKFPHVDFRLGSANTLFENDQLPFTLADLPKHFTPFRKKVEPLSLEQPLASPAIMPPLVTEYSELDELISNFVGNHKHPVGKEGLDVTSGTPVTGGTINGVNRLRYYLHESHRVSTYKETRNGLRKWDDSTKLSFWLACGALSAKQVITELRHYEHRHGANESTYWVYFELLWREYFYWYAMKHKSQLFKFRGVQGKALLTSFWPQRFAMWCQGTTQWPLVNALMKQLNATGYMSNRGRQIVASCLVHELQLDWRYGAAYFEQQLIDFDVASNWGNWQYLAGVGADPRGHRHFDLSKQAAQFDPDNKFIETWLSPEEIAGAAAMNMQNLEVDIADWPVKS